MKIYADNAATTRVSDTALAAMTPCFQEIYGNPSSLHTPGQRAAEKLAAAQAIFCTEPACGSPGDHLHLRRQRRTTRPSVPRRPWGRSGANVISSQRNSSTMPCPIPSRPWSGRALK